MPISLYDATAGHFIQQLGALEHFLGRGAKHFTEAGIDPAKVVETRLHETMLPFRYQVEASIGHSVSALEATKSGMFKPPYGSKDADYAALQKAVSEAKAVIEKITPASIDEAHGRDVAFVLSPERKLVFEAQDFLMTFSLPNFYFHVSMAYAILRAAGVPLGKKDFIGRTKLKA
jgi:hypothetical protein